MGAQLTGTFKMVTGSQGAGQVSYNLQLTNDSQDTCYVAGPPVVVLLGTDGAELPTFVYPRKGVFRNVKVLVAPGGAAHAGARFSPSVPGTGDSQSGSCQPKAVTLRLTPGGGGTVDVPIQPPTSVCERGTLNFDPFAAG